MPVIAEVQFAHEDGAIAYTLDHLPHVEARIMREASTAPEESVYYLRFENDSTDTIQSVLEDDHTVSEATPMPKFGDEHLWAVEFAETTKLLAPQVTSEGGLVVDARSSTPGHDPRGWHERWVLPNREAIHDIWEYAREEDFAFSLHKYHQGGRADTKYRGIDALTEEQRQTLTAAYERGYFAEPRETSLEELGETLDLSASAVGGRLKRGMKSLVGGTLVVDRPGE